MNQNSQTKEQGSEILQNSRWEKFAQLVADGNSVADAYREVYKTKASSSRAASARLLANVSVRARVDYLKNENAKAFALSREEKRKMLADIARGAENVVFTKHGERRSPDYRARISAIQEDNKMTGDSAENVNIGGDGITINLGKFLND